MKDIAEQLGVSNVTVSKALNNKDGVSESLKQEIKVLAKEMNYFRSSPPKSVRNNKTNCISILVPERFMDSSQSFYLNLYKKINKKLEEQGYYGILHIISNQDEQELILPKVYFEQKVDGFILLGQPRKAYIKEAD